MLCQGQMCPSVICLLMRTMISTVIISDTFCHSRFALTISTTSVTTDHMTGTCSEQVFQLYCCDVQMDEATVQRWKRGFQRIYLCHSHEAVSNPAWTKRTGSTLGYPSCPLRCKLYAIKASSNILLSSFLTWEMGLSTTPTSSIRACDNLAGRPCARSRLSTFIKPWSWNLSCHSSLLLDIQFICRAAHRAHFKVWCGLTGKKSIPGPSGLTAILSLSGNAWWYKCWCLERAATLSLMKVCRASQRWSAKVIDLHCPLKLLLLCHCMLEILSLVDDKIQVQSFMLWYLHRSCQD